MGLLMMALWSCQTTTKPANTFSFQPERTNHELLSLVDPMIGTNAHGHTFPGATAVRGMVQLSPDTHNEGWDWCSGYHYSDSSIMGFSHTHLSGTGRPDLLDILVMPMTGEVKTEPGSRANPDEGYRSRFTHGQEYASPGYYAVLLQDYGIQAELTAAKRVGMHQYTFQEGGAGHILFDLTHGHVGDSVKNSMIEVVNDSTIQGVRFSKGWGKGDELYWCNQKVFFRAEFSKPFKSFAVGEGNNLTAENTRSEGIATKGYFTFDVEEGEKILLKVAISPVDLEGAANNMATEVPHWDFDTVRKSTEQEWTNYLKSFEIKTDSARKRTFYTAVYHSLIAPMLYTDADGRYRGSDDQVHTAEGFTNYTTFSLWDTFRATHPLHTYFAAAEDYVHSMLAQYQEYGLLPVWSLYSSETNCMIGYHSVPVIWDAYQKGFQDFDAELAYEAMKKSAMQSDFGIGLMDQYNFLPMDLEGKSVSKTLEYAYDDWCIAQMAKALGKESDYQYFMKRSMAYQNVFDPSDNFMKGRTTAGNFNPEFDPTYASYKKSDYVEGNAWQYSWFVPHDTQGLINLMGGEEAFIGKLDSLFTVSPEMNEDRPHDITGLIGQYAHGNEPSHHVAYLYNYAGQPWKTQARLHEIMTTLYSDQADGLSGNEDCGQMSAWYVFSAMGFYPVNPADGYLVFGTPMLEEVTWMMPTGLPLTIKAEGLSDENKYIQSISWNGEPYEKLYFELSPMGMGGELVFTMGSEPNPELANYERPPSVSKPI